MATRDLTPQFVECRRRKSAFGLLEGNEPQNGRLLDDTGGHGLDVRIAVAPVWVDLVDELEELMAKLDKKMAALSNFHTKRLMVGRPEMGRRGNVLRRVTHFPNHSLTHSLTHSHPSTTPPRLLQVTFDDDSESAQEAQIDKQTQEVTAVLRMAEKKVKEVAALEGDEAEMRVRKNVQISLAKRLQERSTRYRSLQKEYMNKLARQKSGASGGSELDFLTERKRSSATSSSIQVGFTQQQLQVVDDLEAVAQERDEEITRIAQSIEELSTIFKELAVLVIDQGTILDRIDFNMEQVVEHTKEGLGQLAKAEKHQKSARPIKCIALLLFLIAVMITILVFKHKDKNNG